MVAFALACAHAARGCRFQLSLRLFFVLVVLTWAVFVSVQPSGTERDSIGGLHRLSSRRYSHSVIFGTGNFLSQKKKIFEKQLILD